MPVIKVTSPFSLRLDSDSPIHEFPVGEHAISDDELAHWFIQGSLKDGRIILTARADASDLYGETRDVPSQSLAPAKDELMKLNREKLVELAEACGITVADNANKSTICDVLLAGREGVTLVKSPDGVYVEKVEAE